MKMLPRILMHVKQLSWEMVTIIKPRVTEYNHRGTERTEDERTENYDYPGKQFSRLFKLLDWIQRSLQVSANSAPLCLIIV